MSCAFCAIAFSLRATASFTRDRATRNPRPLFVVGLPRSGTTLLHIPSRRSGASRAVNVEVMSHHTKLERSTRRIRQQQNLAMLRWLAPTFESVHATGADLPQECVSLMSRHS